VIAKANTTVQHECTYTMTDEMKEKGFLNMPFTRENDIKSSKTHLKFDQRINNLKRNVVPNLESK
jgi:hypothetical protein